MSVGSESKNQVEKIVQLARPTVLRLWEQYHFFVFGALGWALIYSYYPFGWALPKYAEF